MGLDDDPFTWQLTKDGKVRVFRGGRPVATIAGDRAAWLQARLAGSPEAAQQALARVTGNYRRGNERRGNEPG